MRGGRRTILSVFAATASSFAIALVAGCLPGAGPPLLGADDSDGSSTNLEGDAGLPKSDVDLGDPFSIDGLAPSHGPYTGGTTTQIGGRGFSSSLEVLFGGVPATSVIASDPTHAVLVTPPGAPGYVDVEIRDHANASSKILKDGWYYDAFVVQPSSGATSGGTRISLTGSGTAWASGTTVQIGGVDCQNVAIASATSITCVTPPGEPGAKDVVVTAPSTAPLQARDAFTYSDSPDGYRGGLAGAAFAGSVKVLAFDSLTGTPIAGAFAVAGGSLATAVVQTTSASGVTEFDGLSGTSVTITVAAKCHQPMTYVAVPVDTVTAYLDPTLDPSCAQGDPPSGGGGGGIFGGEIDGQLVFPGDAEFQRNGWTTVPLPTRPTERQAAYVFEAAGSPTDGFSLPDVADAITPDTSGTQGYKYSIVVFPGNATIYVVAGLEDRSLSPPTFEPFAMGVARGVSVPQQTRVTGVDISMDIPFDHVVTTAPQPPAPGPRGPDRYAGSVAVTLGAAGYAIFPNAAAVQPLPLAGQVPFVGVPALDHALAGEEYVLSAVAATGAKLQEPASLVSRINTTDANDTITIGGFLGVPVLAQPGAGVWSGTHVSVSGGTGPVDMTVIQIASGDGLVAWTIAAPGAATDFDVPDLSALPGPDRLGLVHGAIATQVSFAHIAGFSYGNLRQGQLSQSAWNAAAFDSLSGAY